MKPKKYFKAIDLFDRRKRVIFDQKSGDIIRYTEAEEDDEPEKAEPEPEPEEQDPNQISLF